MLDQVMTVVSFVLEKFVLMWPYLLLSIPLTVAIRVTDSSKYIRRVFVAQPVLAIVLATLVGAFSPLCSCGVIPLIVSLLLAGVPLGPVMAFWVASPTMDPEVFFLSAGMLGMSLALVRVAATLILSLSAGFLAHYLEQRGVFRAGILREQKLKVDLSWNGIKSVFRGSGNTSGGLLKPAYSAAGLVPLETITVAPAVVAAPAADASCETCAAQEAPVTLTRRILDETVNATLLIVKFMVIAFLLEAVITLYIPQEPIVNVLGQGNPFAIVLATLISVPLYTNNIAALPLVSGLLQQGLLPGAALAFLIGGPTTTIPAMAAVFGVAKPRVFALYLAIPLVGAIVLGYGYQLILTL